MRALPKSGVLCLALLWLPAHIFAAPAKTHHGTQKKGKSRATLKGRLVRTIPARVTLFYSFKDKKTGKLLPMAAVSRTVVVKVVKPSKRK